MDEYSHFEIDSIIKEEDKITGFAIYPLEGSTSYREGRHVHRKHEMNKFRYAPYKLLLKNNNTFDEIVIGDIEDDGTIIIRNLPPAIQKVFDKLPRYVQRSDDFL